MMRDIHIYIHKNTDCVLYFLVVGCPKVKITTTTKKCQHRMQRRPPVNDNNNNNKDVQM